VPTQSPPCDWPVTPCGELPEPEDESYEGLRSAAAEIVWALSGRQFGCCERTVRPCRRDCAEGHYPRDAAGGWPAARLTAGEWVNMPCGRCVDGCSCGEVSAVTLPGPVCEVFEIIVDGAALPTGAYRVDDLDTLIRTDGSRWPECQDRGKNLGAEGTWGVRYSVGTPVPSAGQRALGEMMSELYKGCSGKTCNLPQRVRLPAKLGPGVLDPMDFLERGKTGLYFVDLFLAAINPQARPSGARVLSPDFDPGSATTWP
jgi:hypothetical protein